MQRLILSTSLVLTFLWMTVSCSSEPRQANSSQPAVQTTPPSPATKSVPVTVVPTKPLPQASPAPKKPRHEYPLQVVNNFVETCTAGRGAAVEAICQCSIAKIQDQYTLKQFADFDSEVRDKGKPPAMLVKIVQSCRPE